MTVKRRRSSREVRYAEAGLLLVMSTKSHLPLFSNDGSAYTLYSHMVGEETRARGKRSGAKAWADCVRREAWQQTYVRNFNSATHKHHVVTQESIAAPPTMLAMNLRAHV